MARTPPYVPREYITRKDFGQGPHAMPMNVYALNGWDLAAFVTLFYGWYTKMGTKSFYESEKLLSCGEYGGYPYVVMHNGLGFRTAYIGVDMSSVFHGKSYDDVNDNTEFQPHGGFTYSGPDIDRGSGLWWLGFDAAHCGDAPDESLLPKDGDKRALDIVRTLGIPGSTIKGTDYMAEQCRAFILKELLHGQEPDEGDSD